MSFDNFSIQVQNLSKVYNIYSKPIDRLKQAIVPRLLHLTGRTPRAYYHEFWALRDVSLNIQKGETVGIIGRNGSGKSTLLQAICGTITPTTGSVLAHGRIAALLELGSGFNPEFTGRENVFLNGAILGLSQDEISQRFDAIAAFADIGEFIEQPVKIYSSGMMVRLAFAVQAMVDPEILIVDEALAVGDERFQRKCFHRLEELKKSGTTILFVSHSSQQIVELCDRAVLLEAGQRVLLGEPLRVTRAYHKLIYADSSTQQRLLQEFKALDEAGGEALNRPDLSEEPPDLLPVKDEAHLSETDFYDPSLIPQSTEYMPEMGAKIKSIQIFNRAGKKVNNLLLGDEYRIEIRGVFLSDQEAVRFGCHIRTKSGLILAGMGHPLLSGYFYNIKRGQAYKLTFTVRMNLTPDVYFVGSGIWSAQEPSRLHQVLDLVMFRVLPRQDGYSVGYVDLSVGEPEFELRDTRAEEER